MCLCVLFIHSYYFFVDSDKGIPVLDRVLEIDEVRSACICRWLHVMYIHKYFLFNLPFMEHFLCHWVQPLTNQRTRHKDWRLTLELLYLSFSAFLVRVLPYLPNAHGI